MLDTVKGIEIFATGTHKGRAYSERDIDSMIANHKRFSSGPDPIVDTPAAIGHEEHQDLLENTGLPRVGRWTNLRKTRRAGRTILLADLENVPPRIAKLLESKSYTHCSSEVYDKPPSGCSGGSGRMLRRCVLLGAELPAIKDLKSFSSLLQTHSERPASPRQPSSLRLRSVRPSRDGCSFSCFFEREETMPDNMPTAVNPPSRDEIVQELIDSFGGKAAILGKMSDDQLAHVLDLCHNASEDSDDDQDADPEVAEVEAHAEKFSEDFRKMGTEPKDVVRAFKTMRKAHGTSAREFLNTRSR